MTKHDKLISTLKVILTAERTFQNNFPSPGNATRTETYFSTDGGVDNQSEIQSRMIDKSLDLGDVVRVLESVDSLAEDIVEDSCHLGSNLES